MSTAVMPDSPTDVTEPVDPPEVVREKAGVDRTTSLLIEYRASVQSLNKRFGRIDESDWEDEIARFRPIIVAAERLARYASGLIESARIPQIDKIELQLRNAELEAELIQARHLIG